MITTLKKPSAWIPIVLSVIWVVWWVYRLITFGTPHREVDEGAAAHLFQIWLVVEVVMIIFFGVRWLAPRPKHAITIITLQIVLALAACAPVWYFHL